MKIKNQTKAKHLKKKLNKKTKTLLLDKTCPSIKLKISSKDPPKFGKPDVFQLIVN